MKPLLDRQSQAAYAVLALLLVVLVLALRFGSVRDPGDGFAIVDLECSSASDSLQQKLDFYADDSLRINSDNAFAIRKYGFSYYEICQILAHREAGFFFDSLPDLLVVRHIDTAHLYSVAHLLSFVHDSASVRWQRPSFRDGDYRKREFHQWPKHDRRIPFFLADSLSMAEAGMSADAWDTLRLYQSLYVLSGSTTIDSLVSSSPSDLAVLLRAHALPRRPEATTEQSEFVHEPVEVNSASVELLIELPYIKAKTAQAIVDYRDRLGGFVSLQQLSEVWAVGNDRLDDVTRFLVVDSMSVRKINVNSSNPTRMKRHPYFLSDVQARLAQLQLDKGAHKLDSNDVRRAIKGLEVSPFFWSYVSFRK